MIDNLLLFLNWLKAALAKETLFALVSVPLAVFFSWLADKVFKTKLERLEIEGEVRYWLYLFFTFFVIIYGIRLVEMVIHTVVLKKDVKE